MVAWGQDEHVFATVAPAVDGCKGAGVQAAEPSLDGLRPGIYSAPLRPWRNW